MKSNRGCLSARECFEMVWSSKSNPLCYFLASSSSSSSSIFAFGFSFSFWPKAYAFLINSLALISFGVCSSSSFLSQILSSNACIFDVYFLADFYPTREARLLTTFVLSAPNLAKFFESFTVVAAAHWSSSVEALVIDLAVASRTCLNLVPLLISRSN